MCLLVVNHIIACVWFHIGDSTEAGWMDVNFPRRGGLDESHFYLISLHWALTQFHGSVGIEPHTELERFFAVYVLVLALVVYAGFVSTVTSLLWQIHTLQRSRMTL